MFRRRWRVGTVPERIKITVRPSGSHPDVLTIEDAMEQVLDVFKMLESAPSVEWKLVNATTNSPLQIEAEAVSFEASVDISVVARAQKHHLARNLHDIARGVCPTDEAFKSAVAKRFFARNLNGVGATEIDLDNGETFFVTPRIAQAAISTLEKKPTGLFEKTVARDEIGSIEGKLSDIGTHYNFPAVKIVEARTGDDLWCRLSDELQDQLYNKASYKDVWQHRRVIVRGRIKYNKDSKIDYVIASDVRRIDDREVSLEAIRDPSFTGGLSIVDYLDRFRDGKLG